MPDFTRVCEQAAKTGGEVLLRMRGKIRAREKAPADLVTEADLASQEAIRSYVLSLYPDHAFLGEEDVSGDEHVEQATREFTWIVDPLDGTTNYVHGLENYCVSVALQRDDEIVAGAVYDPVRGDCFQATLGKGATCNGEAINVSDVRSLDLALVAASLPTTVNRDSLEIQHMLEVMFRCQALRRLGSAALNLCYLAAGRLDAYWATSVQKWDVAAGLLLVQEAGGVITHIDGSRLDIECPRFVATGHSSLHQELVELLAATSSVEGD